jgi:hypothetical protein
MTWVRLIATLTCSCSVRCACPPAEVRTAGPRGRTTLRAALAGVCELPAADEPVRECVVDELLVFEGAACAMALPLCISVVSSFCPTSFEVRGSQEIVLVSTKFQVQLGSA